ncbi:hypothetical protein [Streptomyces sp. XD-27]|uniref:hypothetical protein n=1 Tax=Streptomyces sp. XD-27 TaxID=3062779 RepID=UPI0026F40EB0|nr:hypothetical protein [Streptomyces sp. XD-27]WKX69554.1 hypothetical protein Q3Y56_06180 [Streptomyces sp. XD-27]
MSTSVPLPPLGTRRSAAALAALACGAATWMAAPAAVAAPGDNGDVKVHSAGTPVTDQRNETRVCGFYLAGLDFDTVQEVNWAIVPQGEDARSRGLSGGISLAGGMGRTDELSLPDGTYRLTWNIEGQTRAGKQKVFNVDCASQGKAAPRPAAGSENDALSQDAEASDPAEGAQGTADEGSADDAATGTTGTAAEEGTAQEGATEAGTAEEGATEEGTTEEGATEEGAAGAERNADDSIAAGADTKADLSSDDAADTRDSANVAPRGPVGAGGGGESGDSGSGLSAGLIVGVAGAGTAGAAGLFLLRRARRRPNGVI